MKYPAKEYTMKNQYELIVLGSGASGLTAALRARENGVKEILVLEKSPYVGGNSRCAGGMFATSGKFIEAVGCDMDTDAFYQKAIRDLKYSVNPAVVKRYLYATGESVDWLADSGLKFEARKMPFGCTMCNIESEELAAPYKDTAPTGHSYMGTAVVAHLKAQCEKYGIPIVTSARATALITDETGAVTGVQANVGTESRSFGAKAVILATGGVAGTVASLHEFFPQTWDEDDSNFSFGSAQCVGDGIHMAERIGADTRRAMGVLIKGPSHLGPGGTQGLTYSADSLIVTQYGYRFIDESVVFDYHEALNNIPKRTTYTIADATLVQELNDRMPPQSQPGTSKPPVKLLEGLQQEADSGKNITYIGDSLEEAAKRFDIPVENLLRTVEEYNAMCRKGQDTLLGKDPKHLREIKTAPFYVLKGIRSTDSSRGGVTIDEDFRALRKDGTPIPGLYAVGDIAQGWAAEVYAPNGAGFTWSFNSGYLCGKVVAESLS
jgi:fumarate reductase flavoprotein subunit